MEKLQQILKDVEDAVYGYYHPQQIFLYATKSYKLEYYELKLEEYLKDPNLDPETKKRIEKALNNLDYIIER